MTMNKSLRVRKGGGGARGGIEQSGANRKAQGTGKVERRSEPTWSC